MVGLQLLRVHLGLMGGGAALPTRVEEPGRLGYDARRRRLLVPLTAAERLHVEPL